MDTLYGTPFAPWGPSWSPGRRGQGSSAGASAQMRIGDAERSKVGDELARHFAEGRLDEGEFNERLNIAMSAKTQGDLVGLLSDLPPAVPPQQPSMPQQKQLRRPSRVLGVVLLVLLVSWMVPWLVAWPFHGHVHVGWIIPVLIVSLCMWRRHHHHLHGFHHPHEHGGDDGYGNPRGGDMRRGRGRSSGRAGWGPGDPWAA